MLRKISGPCSVYVYGGEVYLFKGARHDVGLSMFSAATKLGDSQCVHEETAHALIFDEEQTAFLPANRGVDLKWFPVLLARSGQGEKAVWAASTERRLDVREVSNKPEYERCTSPHIVVKRKRTSDVLGRDHDEDLVVPAAHEKVVEDLKEEKKSEDTKVIFLPPPPEAQAELDRVKQLLAAQAEMRAVCPPGGR